MILSIIQTVLRGNSSRKANIMDFCNAYLKCEQFSIMTFLSKSQRHCIEESIEEFSTSIESLAQRMNSFKLETMAEEIFKTRPSEIPYVITFLEYSLYKQSALQTFSPQEFTSYITDVLYCYSDFYPIRRYNIIVCMFLYFFNLL